jgi:uncharacterized protein (DUF924 family)
MYEDVLAFWFGRNPAEPAPEIARRWFVRDDKFDAEIRERFGALYDKAVKTNMPEWANNARAELAMVIVLDQFSRNLFRDDPRAFAQDGRAMAWARNLYFSDRVKQLAPVERAFLLMPFQHTEDLSLQREGVAEYEKLANETGNTGMFAAYWDFAKRHMAIIERFGRFPHRNKVLGRESTPEERAFLEQPDSTF